MRNRLTPARPAVVPGALLLAVWFALVGCSQGAGSAKEGPITTRLKAIYGHDGGEDRLLADHDRAEDIIAACMKEKGFEYTPTPLYSAAFDYTTGSEEDWDPVADAEDNGYWITPASKADLIERYGEDRSVEDDRGDDDPNRDYYDSLSASDQAAYDEAMVGTTPDDSEEYDWKASGCSGQAFHEVYESRLDQPDSTVMDDFAAYTEDKVDNDPRTIETGVAWASCMADKGYAFTTPDEAQESIQRRFEDLTGVDTTSGEPVTDVDRFSDAELRALRADEIATATADARCAVDAGTYSVYDEVLFDLETEFYNTHKAEVDAYLEALKAAQDG